ncbi:autotransporter domain-containing protein [Xanthobacter sp. V4C-4]|uniref:autotransporter outer membrane beta-barrel domain-containing protein n=1 Tax=Xanthobacter cornucopiae TaxID=3119924 RepID=UPI0037284775
MRGRTMAEAGRLLLLGGLGASRAGALARRAGPWGAASALALLAPLAAAAQESATIPLHPQKGSGGFSKMIVVSVGDGADSTVLLDTGSTGLYVRRNKVGPDAVPVTDDDGNKVQFKYGYSSGNEVKGYYATATVAFPEASTELATDPIMVGVVTKLTCKANKPDCPGWQKGQSGVMGVAYSAESSGIFNPLAQLPGTYANGFMVVSNDLADPGVTPHVQVGLTAETTGGFVWTGFQSEGTTPTGLKAWNTKSITTCFSVNAGSPGCYVTVFDTGAGEGLFETGESGSKKGPVKSGSQVTTTVPGVMYFTTEAGDKPNTNTYVYDPAHGTVAGYNSGAQVFRYYVVAYDAVNGRIGFAPLQNVLLGTIDARTDADLGVSDGSVLLMGRLVARQGLSSARAIAIGTGGRFHVAGDATLSGTLSGSVDSTIKIAKDATFTLSGVSTYDGTVTVSGRGTLRVDGSLPASLLLDRSTLSGTGIVGNVAVAKGATVAPGASVGAVGTLTVAGSAVFAKGSTFAVELGAGTLSDRLAVRGGAALTGGDVSVSLTEGASPALGRSYTVLTAAEGVTGRFSSVGGSAFATVDAAFPFLAPGLSYGDDAVALTFARSTVPFTVAAHTGNQAAVARAADTLDADSGVLAALASLNRATAPAAFDALSGEIYASAQTVMQQQSAYLRDAVGARLRQSGEASADLLSAPAAAALSAALTPAVWAQGFGGWGHLSADAGAAGVSDSIGGVLFGVDAEISGWRAGLVGGISQSGFSASGRGSSGSMDSYDLGAYAGTRLGPLAVSLGAAYGWHDVSVDRTILFPGYWGAASGDYSTGTAQVFGEVSAAVALAAVRFEPFAGLAYVNVDGATLRETGSSAALALDVAAADTLYSTLGLRAAVPTELFGHALTASLSLGWQHAFGDDTPVVSAVLSAGALPAEVAGVPVARDTALIGAGLRYAVAPGAELALKYVGQIAANASENAVTGQLRWQF